MTVAQYHNLWVAICYNAATGFMQDYTMKFSLEGSPYCPGAKDFSVQYEASFRPRRTGTRHSSAPRNDQHASNGGDIL